MLCVVGCLAHYYTTKERVKPEGEEEPISIFKTFRMLYGYRPYLMNTLYIICYGLVLLLVMSCLNYYATYVLGSTAAATNIQIAYLVSAVGISVLISPIDQKLGRKATMLLAAAVLVLGKVWFIIAPHSLGAIYVSAITTGIGATITFVMFNTNRNNLSDLVAKRAGRRLDGMIGTADNLASKLGEAGAVQLIGITLSRAGLDASLPEQSAKAIERINILLGWAPAVVGVVMIVVVLFLNIEQEMARLKQSEGQAS